MCSHLAETLDLILFKRKAIKGLFVSADIFSTVCESRKQIKKTCFHFKTWSQLDFRKSKIAGGSIRMDCNGYFMWVDNGHFGQSGM